MTRAWSSPVRTLMALAGLAVLASSDPVDLASALQEPPAPKAQAEGSSSRLRSDLRHFFEGNLPRGTIRELALDPQQGHPKRLWAMGDGLAWTCTGSKFLFLIFPDGLGLVWQPSEAVDFGWIPEKQTAWVASNRGQHVSILPAQAFHREGLAGEGRAFGPLSMPPSEPASRPGGLVRSPGGWFHRLDDRGGISRFPSRWVYQRPGRNQDTLQFTCTSHTCLDLAIDSLVAGPNGKVLGLAKDGIAIFDADQPLKGRPIPIIRAAGVRRAIATDAGIWYLVPASNTLSFHSYPTVPGADGESRRRSLGPVKGQVFDLVLGPDGHLWFTELLAGNIGRLDPDTGAIERFPMPIPGTQPAFLVDGGDGKLYFTELGSFRLGSISVGVPPRAELAPAEPVPQEAPPPRKKGKPPKPEAMPQPPEPTPVPPQAPPAAPAPPLEPLAALARRCPDGVNWTHIRSNHYFCAPNDKGQFHQAWSQDLRVASLIHRCIIDPLCPLYLTYEGKWMAIRTFEDEIGYYLNRDRQWTGTRNLVVILSPDQTFVVTAYPVGPNF